MGHPSNWRQALLDRMEPSLLEHVTTFGATGRVQLAQTSPSTTLTTTRKRNLVRRSGVSVCGLPH